MRSGHVIYKVKDLNKAVEEWQNKGFRVEYGRKKNPYNALIYFSKGAYIELLQSTGMPKLVKFVAKFLGFGKHMEKFDYWDNCAEGFCGLCIEKDGSLNDEIAFLKQNGIEGVFLANLKRTDMEGRTLKFKCFFPKDINFPFLMSYFNIDPKPLDFVHPNGIKKIKKIIFKTDEKSAEILRQLIMDDDLEIIIDEKNKGAITVEYDR